MTVPDLDQPAPMDPVAALIEVAFWLDRARAESRRAEAFLRAAATYSGLPAAQRADLDARQAWAEVPGLGPKTVSVIREALAGDVPGYLARVRAEAAPIGDAAGAALRERLRGDLHTHTEESDGSAPVEVMADVASRLGHEYLLVTDHSPRLRVANGLSAERLAAQGERIDALNARAGNPFRVLKGIEVDILDDGSLDQTPAALAALDVVVASVHSHLRADSEAMTLRMVGAVANPRTNVLGHCTGRLVEGSRGVRPQSTFDAEVVFEACRQFDVAVEINSRPERQDPPDDLLALAIDTGCLFSIDTDAHAPGQLDFLSYGCTRAAAAGVDPARIVNTWPLDELLDWARG